MPPSPDISLSGRIDRIAFYDRRTHFTIARLISDENQKRITIKGVLPDPRVGETIEVRGKWASHPRYGQQFAFKGFTERLPASVDGIRNVLASGVIKGIRSKLMNRIVAHFGGDTLKVIESDANRLTEVRGVGERTAQRIAETWRSHRTARQLMGFLEQIGLDCAIAEQLLQTYGSRTADILCSDPYRVAQDLPGIGFRIADAVVQHVETPVDEVDRAEACLNHLLEQVVERGHTYVEQTRLFDRCRQLFGLEGKAIEEGLQRLLETESVVRTRHPGKPQALVFPRSLYEAETVIARRIAAMQSLPVENVPADIQKLAGDVASRLAIPLSRSQWKVIRRVLDHKVSVITGGPGTGKTTLIRSITAVLEGIGRRVLLMAPTGRAARRLAEVTGRSAVTLHKALGYQLADGSFQRSVDHPLQTDAVIVDEASMVDTLLMMHLLKAVPVTAALILVGDVFQLPPVGPGNVLADLLRCGSITAFELNEIFRQEGESAIVANAHRVRNGKAPVMAALDDPEGLSDFYFLEQADPERTANTVVRLCRDEIPAHFRKEGGKALDPVGDIQVLTPMHRGPVGTLNLNRRLQAALNPNGDEVTVLGSRFKVGDKVMHLQNNYHKEVFNGEIGMLHSIDTQRDAIEVAYEERLVTYGFVELEELALAYAISVHKSQGSEYPGVVIPLVTQHYVMLQRNLLYTALTRAKQLVILVGNPKALAVALENNRPWKRRSMLAHRLSPAVHPTEAG